MADEQGESQEIAICHACGADPETRLERAQARVVELCGVAVSLSPALFLALSFCATWTGKPWVPDDRIVWAVISGFGAVLAFGFKSGGCKR